MKIILLLGVLYIGSAIFITGYNINKSINKNAGWEKQKAYMKGIEAKSQYLPITLIKDKTYIIQTIQGTGGKVDTVFYIGYEE